MKVILLAAGVGRRFGKRTRRLPKCLIPLGEPQENLLTRYLDSFRTLGLKKIIVVVGHQKEKIIRECKKRGQGLSLQFIFNKNYKKGSIVSLHTAVSKLTSACLIMDADVFFPRPALKRLLNSKHPSAFLVDTRSKSTGEEMMIQSKQGRPFSISKTPAPGLKILGEATGFFKIDAKHTILLKKILSEKIKHGETNLEYEAAYNILIKKIKVGFEKIDGLFWTEMDFEEDLKRIKEWLGDTRPCDTHHSSSSGHRVYFPSHT